MHLYKRISFPVLLAVTMSMASARADLTLNITVENLQGAGGYFFTPVWVGLHEGGFDAFDSGSAASAAVEALAEDGMTGPISTDFASGLRLDAVIAPGTPFGPSGSSFSGSASTTVTADETDNRFLNYASMILLSNDTFFGNDNALELFDAGGLYLGDQVITITADDLWDAGTEDNTTFGAPFSTLGGTATDTIGGVISQQPIGALDNFVGVGTANGESITDALTSGEAIARITITAVPEPSSIAMLMLGAIGLASVRRRRAVA